jgi:hypothetical protein
MLPRLGSFGNRSGRQIAATRANPSCPGEPDGLRARRDRLPRGGGVDRRAHPRDRHVCGGALGVRLRTRARAGRLRVGDGAVPDPLCRPRPRAPHANTGARAFLARAPSAGSLMSHGAGSPIAVEVRTAGVTSGRRTDEPCTKARDRFHDAIDVGVGRRPIRDGDSEQPFAPPRRRAHPARSVVLQRSLEAIG